ncbi:uncharacterized protein C8A04DRAFT_38985 [Dichotomopilus funicola]|uniref:Diphthamide biosynthesis protein 4 n=1 Tax=Dichotomopilus funicola TaxID=1934379 RepID=A0AAN6ZJI8_9PEZI|nr:hypothetical protein C8A04DRAFT_38985 [Dichotomopilus funicola]
MLHPKLTPTYYEILSLSPSSITEAEDDSAAAALVKRAYRRALLKHHPDKTSAAAASTLAAPKSSQYQLHESTIPPSSSPPSLLSPPSSTRTGSIFTIDQISAAYATLSRPSLRQAYDTALLLQARDRQTQNGGAGGVGGAGFQTGIETVDLDDLDCDEGVGTGGEGKGEGEGEMTWYRGCRCGNGRGYQFGEEDLEEAADLGELMVGCVDCSLWLRVCFAVVDGEEGGTGGKEGTATAGG